MVELIDLSGYVEEGQPSMHGKTHFWTTLTHEECAWGRVQTVGEDNKTRTIERELSNWEPGDEELTPQVRGVSVSEHGPTHIDAVCHLDPTSDVTIDDMDLDRFYSDAVGVDVSSVEHDEFITVDHIQESLEENDLEIRDGDAITLYTGHRDEYYSLTDIEKKHIYIADNPGLDEEAAYWLGEQGISNVGIDAPSIDQGRAMAEEGKLVAHDMCAEYGAINMEHMDNLDRVAGLRYTLCAFPLKLRDGTGSPIRPVAILE